MFETITLIFSLYLLQNLAVGLLLNRENGDFMRLKMMGERSWIFMVSLGVIDFIGAVVLLAGAYYVDHEVYGNVGTCDTNCVLFLRYAIAVFGVISLHVLIAYADSSKLNMMLRKGFYILLSITALGLVGAITDLFINNWNSYTGYVAVFLLVRILNVIWSLLYAFDSENFKFSLPKCC